MLRSFGPKSKRRFNGPTYLHRSIWLKKNSLECLILIPEAGMVGGSGRADKAFDHC